MKKKQDSLFRYNIVIEDSSSEDAPPMEILLNDNKNNKRKYPVPSKPLYSNDKKAKVSHDPDEFSDDDLLIVSYTPNNRLGNAAKPVPAKQPSQDVLRYNNALKSLDALSNKPTGPVVADLALQEKLAKARRLKATIAHQQQSLASSSDHLGHDDDDVKQDPNTIIMILRYQEGERQFTFAVKKSEKFQSLYEKVSTMLGIPMDQLQIRFYHEVIEKNKTPHDYSMINQEKLAITRLQPEIAEPVKASRSSNTNTNSNNDPTATSEGDLDFLAELERKLQNPEDKPKSAVKKIVLHVALPDQAKHLKLKILPTEKFEKIIDIIYSESGKKIRLNFDGEPLDPQSTPADEEMEDGFQLDAKYI